MSESQKTEKAENQEVAGSTNREPTEGKWVAEPRVPDPKREGDGVTRLTTEQRDGSSNPQNRQPGPDDDSMKEKVVESGVEDNKIDVETEVALSPRNV